MRLTRSDGSELEGLVDSDEAARTLGTSARHIRRLVAERRLPFVKVGAFVRFRREDLQAFIEDAHVDKEA